MRTNIDIDDELMAATMRATGQTTKKAAVEEAMRRAVRNEELRQVLENMRGIGWDAPEWDERQFAEDGTVFYPEDKE